MDLIQDLLANFNWESIIKTALRVSMILIFAWILTNLLKKFLKRLERHLISRSQEEGEPPSESQKRIETITELLKQASLIALWIIAILIILKELGVEIGPIVASAGIAGLAVGFGAQNLVRDVISGFFIILENQIRVGDVAVINGTGGVVEKINFRTTVLRDLGGTINIFPNGTITTLSNMTNEWSAYAFDIGVAYKEDIDRVVRVLKETGKTMREDEKFSKLILEDIEIFGVDQFADSAVVIKGRIKTKPICQWEVGREFLRRVKYAFDQNNIEIPFPHRTVYFGEDSKPFNLFISENLNSKKS
jgi:small conductance mechanosensitive channel